MPNTIEFSDKKLLDFVRNRPDETLDWNHPVCPTCGSHDVIVTAGMSTCLGWFPAKPEDDVPECPGNPNTSGQSVECRACGAECYYVVHSGIIHAETSERPHKILAGIPHDVQPGCLYGCAACSGDVTVKEVRTPKNEIYYPGKIEHGYRLTCSGCDLDVVIPDDAGYVLPYTYENALHGKGPWKFHTLPGVCVANSRAIQKGVV